MRSRTDSEPRAWLIALPAFAIALLWGPALGGSFQFDDWNVIVNESRVHSLHAWWDSMPGIRPLLKLSYALNSSLSGSPAGFRAVNVLIHAVNATLVFRFLHARGLRAGLDGQHAHVAALLAALVFALHPVQTEAVTYISGRSSSLAACFCLLSLSCWARSERSTAPANGTRWLLASCACFAAAVATKESAVILPFALWLCSADRPARRNMRRLMPFFGLMALALTVALSLPMYRLLLEVSLDTRSTMSNLLTQARALVYLAGQLVRPYNGNADPQLPVIEAADTVSVALSLAWLGVFTWALLRVRRSPVAAFAALWFLLWLTPTNSVLPRLDIANDRQLYLALIGPAWWVAVQLTQVHRHSGWIGHVVAALIVVFLAHASVQRNRIYATETSFWQDAVARNPGSARAANNLAMAHALNCQLEAAAQEFARSIELSPQDFRARINLKLLTEDALPGVSREKCAGEDGLPREGDGGSSDIPAHRSAPPSVTGGSP